MHAAFVRNRDQLCRAGSAREPGEERHVLTPENCRLLASAEREHPAEALGALSSPESADAFMPACQQGAAALAIFKTAPPGQYQRQQSLRSLPRVGIRNVFSRSPIAALDHVLVTALGEAVRI